VISFEGSRDFMRKGEEIKVEMNSDEKKLFKVVEKRKKVKSEIKSLGSNSLSSVTIFS
jgi:hypothetical protein